ncbi:hypothetical protein LOK49_LG12G01523 [Camellia lanceoleosa]|uniref:Uncharacterized protein n=1 Tax=Camellia lanceoleosa TaxID=1840588 RepID=A0ACC0FW63_9ERIC|nr:hypothetical protein LOK49_LG12G01523 [Camellia lanceoleosa]
MSVDELEQGKKWLSDTFYLIRCGNDCLPSINWVLGLAKVAVLRHGVNELVIDPYNELDHQCPPSQTEIEYVSQILTKVKRVAQHHSCHVWKLLEKHIKKPIFDARYGESVERMSVDELEQGKKWLSDTFYLIRCENDCLPSINWVLGLAKAAVLRHEVNGLVIDPYNELDHQRPPS